MPPERINAADEAPWASQAVSLNLLDGVFFTGEGEILIDSPRSAATSV